MQFDSNAPFSHRGRERSTLGVRIEMKYLLVYDIMMICLGSWYVHGRWGDWNYVPESDV
jgi:hypothetical protein